MQNRAVCVSVCVTIPLPVKTIPLVLTLFTICNFWMSLILLHSVNTPSKYALNAWKAVIWMNALQLQMHLNYLLCKCRKIECNSYTTREIWNHTQKFAYHEQSLLRWSLRNRHPPKLGYKNKIKWRVCNHLFVKSCLHFILIKYEYVLYVYVCVYVFVCVLEFWENDCNFKLKITST